jgi:hypothetical protein
MRTGTLLAINKRYRHFLVQGALMSFFPLQDAPRQSSACDVETPALKRHSDTVGMALAGGHDTVRRLLDSARNGAHTSAWVVYRAGALAGSHRE